WINRIDMNLAYALGMCWIDDLLRDLLTGNHEELAGAGDISIQWRDVGQTFMIRYDDELIPMIAIPSRHIFGTGVTVGFEGVSVGIATIPLGVRAEWAQKRKNRYESANHHPATESTLRGNTPTEAQWFAAVGVASTGWPVIRAGSPDYRSSHCRHRSSPSNA